MVTRSSNDAESPPRGYQASGGLVPVPDPTLLTTAQLDREIRNLEAKIITRLDAMDMAAKILHEDYTRIPTELDRQIKHLRELLEEKIGGATEKTVSLDRVVQTRLAGSETALNAAMAAADKVTQKIEINFGAVMAEMKAGMTKQIDTIKESIDDLKGRLDRGEGISRGAIDNGTEQRSIQSVAHSGNQNLITAISATAAVISTIVAIAAIIMVVTHRETPAVVYRPAMHAMHVAAPSEGLLEV
jgi:hypothetical protein